MATVREKIRRFLGLNGRNSAKLLLALLSAISIWLLHGLSLSYSSAVGVPVIASSSLEGYTMQSTNSVLVEAKCRTTGFNMLRLRRVSRKKPIIVKFRPEDLHHKSGELFYATSIDLNAYTSSIFGDITLMEGFLTDTVYFHFVEENHKKVPVVPVYTVSYKDQYMGIGKVQIVPDSVIVYGEERRLDNIVKVSTKSFSLDNLSSYKRGTVKLEPAKGVRISTSEVEYDLDVKRYIEITAVMPVSSRNVPADKELLIYPSTMKVSFRCAFPMMKYPDDNVFFYIDYKDFQSSLGGSCIPRINSLPDGVFDFKTEPSVFDCVERIKE